MNFNDLIENFKTIVLTKSFCAEGRASQKEFWCYILVTFVLSFIPIVGLLLSILLLPASICVTIRRLHDLDKSGLLCILWIFPIINLIILFLCIPEGKKEDNKYGAYFPFLGKSEDTATTEKTDA